MSHTWMTFRNGIDELTTDEDVSDAWTEAGYEVDARDGRDAPWQPWNYEAGFDYERDGYLDPERDREHQAAKAKAREEAAR